MRVAGAADDEGFGVEESQFRSELDGWIVCCCDVTGVEGFEGCVDVGSGSGWLEDGDPRFDECCGIFVRCWTL